MRFNTYHQAGLDGIQLLLYFTLCAIIQAAQIVQDRP
jgi:hypothetical protein